MRPRKRWIRGKEARGRLPGGKKDEVKFWRSQMRFSFEFALISICLRPPVEDCPSADGEDEKFERERDEKTIALNLTRVGSVFPYKNVFYQPFRQKILTSHLSWEVLRPRKDILEIRMSSSALTSIKVANTTNLTNFRPKEMRK